MNLKEIKEMLQLMSEHDLTELEIDKDGLKVKFRKGGSDRIEMHNVNSRSVAVVPAFSSAPQQSLPAAIASGSEVLPSNVVLVKSPMVGTFYGSPAPDQPVYITTGSKIKDGDVLCIIEAMKLMNEIKSEVSGEILEVLVKNGQPIEFDQPLFKVKKA
ncbi:MAG: acetyl-CoA carboxylase biotin carboxyl carrier protein [Candidatus Omnitrophica bacterium]|nr:acetyl-CoA carboxylase biotin carboxyl carrier protein [Candidatus Omnitrophota bacterium]